MRALATQTFAEIAGRYARVMGRKSHINVIFGPYIPTTTDTSILLPQLPAGTILNPYDAKIFNGYLDHETGHHRYTDLDFYMSEEVQDNRCVSLLTNFYEDTRMENAQIERYPGSRTYLDAIAYDATQKIASHFQDEGGFSKNKILLVLIARESYIYRNVKVDPLNGWELRSFDTLVPIADLMAEYMPHLTSTQDAYDLALKVYEYIEDKKDEIKEEMQQKSKGESDGDDSEDETEGEGSGEDGEKGSGGGRSSGLPDFLDEEQEAGDGPPGDLTPEEYEKLRELLDKGAQLQELLKKVAEDNGLSPEDLEKAAEDQSGGYYEQLGTQILPPLTTDNDKIWFTPESDTVEFNKSLERIGNSCAGAQHSLRVFLQSRVKRGFLRGLDHGELDMTNPVKLRMHDKDVYYQKRVTKRINTDLLVLIDMSGSMPCDLTMDAAVSMCEALKPIQKLKVAVGGFYTSFHSMQSPHTPTMAYGRMNPMCMPLFKGFDEAYHRAKFKLGSINTNGLTPLGEAYGHGLELLAPRKTPRKILWLITDGVPYFDRGSDEHSDFILMRQTQRNASRLGITTVGLEIGGADFLHKYVEISARINGIDEMSSAMTTMVHAFLGQMG